MSLHDFQTLQIRMLEQMNRAVHLTETGYEKVHYYTISTTDELIEDKGLHIWVTCSATGNPTSYRKMGVSTTLTQ